ncbi:hypothetical protein Aduo_001480 [Ancylostoma duodenale]
MPKKSEVFIPVRRAVVDMKNSGMTDVSFHRDRQDVRIIRLSISDPSLTSVDIAAEFNASDGTLAPPLTIDSYQFARDFIILAYANLNVSGDELTPEGGKTPPHFASS